MDVLDLEPIKLNGVDFSQQRPVVIAGPCSAETEEQVMNTAHDLAKRGVKIFRAGIWKPRTKPGSFEGIGSEGLKWMKRVTFSLPIHMKRKRPNILGSGRTAVF